MERERTLLLPRMQIFERKILEKEKSMGQTIRIIFSSERARRKKMEEGGEEEAEIECATNHHHHHHQHQHRS